MGSLVGGIAGLATAIIGGNKSQDQMNNAQGALANALAEIQATNPPNPEAIVLQHFQQAGIDTPDLENNINSAFVQLKQNPAQQQALNAQMGALQQIQQTSQGGLTPSDRAALNQIQQQAAGQANQATQSIIQNAQQRGQAGGGTELAAQLQAAQSGANQAQQGGLQIGGQASQNALAAAAQAGQLGGQINQQQYGQAAQQQGAQQAINNFNTQNQLGVQSQNTAAQNQANLVNLQNAQMASNANVQAANQEQQRLQQARQQQYQDSLSRAQAAAGAYGAQAGESNAQAKQIGQEYSNIGQGISEIGSSVGNLVGVPNFGGTGANQATSNGGQANSSGQEVMGPAFWRGGKLVKGYDNGGIFEPSDAKSILDSSSLDTSVAMPDSSKNSSSGSGSGSGGMSSLASMAPMIAMLAARGGQVPGKAKVQGDSPKNDVVNAKLSPGEIVIPRSIAHDPKKAAKFIEEENKKDLHGRLSALEKLCYGGAYTTEE